MTYLTTKSCIYCVLFYTESKRKIIERNTEFFETYKRKQGLKINLSLGQKKAR